MLRLDFYVQHLIRHNAERVMLRSGKRVRFGFADSERETSQPILHAQVRGLVEEAAPGSALDELRDRKQTHFIHASSAGLRVDVRVARVSPDVWTVEIREAPDGPPHAKSVPAPELREVAPPRAGTATQDTHEAANAGRLRASMPPPPRRKPSQVALATGDPPIHRYLRMMVDVGASDLHLSSEVKPMVRLDGEMNVLEERAPLTPAELEALLAPITPERNQRELNETSDTDFAHMIEGVARFRANVFRDRRGVGAVFRQIPFELLSVDQIGLPKRVLDLCWLSKGLVLVTGPTGSGKSTTLATLIDFINENRKDHIITIEDPIEFVHDNKKCLVNQREVGMHTQSFSSALRAALREDPDIVLVGEMRDLETIAIAIETAETGHLVFGTLHTTSAVSTVDRLIDQFPPEQQSQIRVMLSESLRGVVAQVLCKKDGGGRAAAYEVLMTTPAVSNLIREGKTYQIASVMQTGRKLGMQTMNDHLLELVTSGRVRPEEAYVKSNDKMSFKNALAAQGIDLSLDGS
ncbi:MAG: type IV pilus twitching motility protein PilT [Myxococcales bacterium]|nr:type IV pilus twitching motility protein PilT [Myxococcales bacterium]